MMTLASAALAVITALAFALAKPKHYRQVFGVAATPTTRLRFLLGGWVGLALTLWASIGASYDWLIGIAFWCGSLAAAGTAVALLLTYRPQSLRILVPGLASFALVMVGAVAVIG